MKLKLLVIILLIITVCLCAVFTVVGVWIYRSIQEPDTTPRSDAVEVSTSHDAATPTVGTEQESPPSVIQLLDFPDITTSYPQEWPEPYRLPELFQLVEVELGELDNNPAFSAWYRSERNEEFMHRAVLSWLEDLNWTVSVDTFEQGIPVLILAEQPNGAGNCMVTLDVDPDEGTRVMLTLVIEE